MPPPARGRLRASQVARVGAQPLPAGIGERRSKMAARAPRKPAQPGRTQATLADCGLSSHLPEPDRG